VSEDVSIANQEHPVQHAQTKRRSALGQLGRTVAFKELLALALALPHEPCTPPKMSREERGGNRGTHVKGDGKMGKQRTDETRAAGTRLAVEAMRRTTA
jgi:hypothetical protein